MDDERRAYIVGATRIPYEERDVAHAVLTEDDDRGFRDLMGANDDDERHPLGSDVAYLAWLTDEEAETFRAASNCRYVEQDVEAHPHYAGDPAQATIPTPETKAYMRWAYADLGSWHGTDVIVAVLDQGTTQAVRDYMGYTLLGRTTTGDALPSGQELFPTTDDTSGFYKHGCLVAPNCVPPGGKFLDVIVCNSTGTANASNFLAGVKYACDNGARILNYSFGSPPGTTMAQAYLDGFTYAANVGAQIFISMGNDSTAGMGVPAIGSKTYANVISVTNFDEDTDARYTDSNYDSAATGCAPGAGVTSLLPTAVRTLWNGTSASSPHAAQIAVRLCTGGTYTAAQAVAAMKANLRNTGQAAAQQGGGAFDFALALAGLTGSSPVYTGVATPTVVGMASASSNYATASFSVGTNASTAVDDIRVAVITCSSGGNPPPPTGWKVLRNQLYGASRVVVMAKVYDGTEPATTIFPLGGGNTYYGAISVMTLRAIGGIDIDKIVPMVRGGVDAAPTTTQVAPRSTNGLLVQAFFQRDPDAANGTLALPAGLTQQASTKPVTVANTVGYKMAVGTTAVTSGARIAPASATADKAAEWLSVALTVASSPAPVAPPVTARRNLSPTAVPALYITGCSVKFVRGSYVSSVAVGASATRSQTIAGPSGGPLSTWYWYDNVTSDGTTSTTSSDIDLNLPSFACVAGLQYTLSMWEFYQPTGGNPQMLFYVNWLNSAGTSVSTTTGTKQNMGNGTTLWQRVSQVVTAPANAVTAQVQAWNYNLTSTSVQALRWMGILYEVGATLGSYFDGDNANAFWEGTAQYSTSQLMLDGAGRQFDWAPAFAA